MLKDIKLGFKLLKYSYNFKMNMGLTIFILVFGGFLMTLKIDTFVLFGVYTFIFVLMIVQMTMTLLLSQMIAASPGKKTLELTFSDIVTSVGAVLWYLLLTGVSRIFCYFRPQLTGEYNVALVVISVFMFICIIYYGACNKYYMVASIIFAVAFGGVYSVGFTRLSILVMQLIGVNFSVIFTMGLVIVLIACGISCLLRRLLYKKSLSRYIGGNIYKVMK